ncbi:MAG: DJ-1/PfpI family protein [Verrucomicrobiales bacterium]|nr:DJ-1/PfpI family protein [Verrucomicrobiales bacterium]
MNPDAIHRRDWLRLVGLATASTSLAPVVGAESKPSAEEERLKTLHAHPPPQLRMGSEQIAILVYPEFTALDALGPHYALAGMMGAMVRFVAKTRDPVPSEGAAKGGFMVKPHQTFDEVGDGLDLLLVPGGLTGTLAALADDATLRFLRERGGKAKLVGSVCTGSLLLGAAGLLRGRRATSHWQLLEVLNVAGATPVAERVVFDGTDRVTAAGVSAGLDLGFELIRRFRGDFYAKGMQLLGEYDPHPPFAGGGNPRTADKVVVDMLNTMHAPLIPRFKEAVAAAMSRATR